MLCICAAEQLVLKARVQMSAMRCAGLAELVLNAQVVEQMSAMYIALLKLLLIRPRASCNCDKRLQQYCTFTNKWQCHAKHRGRARAFCDFWHQLSVL